MKITQATQGVGHLQQGSIDVVTQASKQIVGRGIQIDHLTAIAQMPPVGRAQDSAATGRQNTVSIPRQFVKYRLLDIAKALLALAFEIVTNRATKLPLDHLIGVKKG